MIAAPGFTTREDFLTRLRQRLLPVDALPEAVMTDVFPGPHSAAEADPRGEAAVLVGLIDRGDDFGVLLTLRPETMRRHAGQVAFPGGRLDPSDKSLLAAALREAYEEVGLPAGCVKVEGQGDRYVTNTGYVVSLFVGLIPSDFVPVPNPMEVASVFETPVSFLMTPANHQKHEREYAGVMRSYYAMPHEDRYIWGATAGMIKSLYDRLYGTPTEARNAFEPSLGGRA